MCTRCTVTCSLLNWQDKSHIIRPALCPGHTIAPHTHTHTPKAPVQPPASAEKKSFDFSRFWFNLVNLASCWSDGGQERALALTRAIGGVKLGQVPVPQRAGALSLRAQALGIVPRAVERVCGLRRAGWCRGRLRWVSELQMCSVILPVFLPPVHGSSLSLVSSTSSIYSTVSTPPLIRV